MRDGQLAADFSNRLAGELTGVQRPLMAIPDFETIMRPLLEHLSDGRERGTEETLDALAEHFGLSDDERRELLPSGKQELFRNRVAWAKFYLKKARAVENPRRGVYRTTARGQELIRTQHGVIDVGVLQQFPEFRDFLLRSRTVERGADEALGERGGEQFDPPPTRRVEVVAPELTPEELLETGYSRLNAQLSVDLLERIMSSSPAFFESLVVDLLLALGYGGSRRDAGRTIGKTGDGGIDGIINEDRLGLDTIYLQAKRWESSVGRPEIQKFAGALQGQRAHKGVFITTSSFTAEAKAFAGSISTKIVLVDGEQLARLMIEHDVGVTSVATYSIKRVDSDYFADE